VIIEEITMSTKMEDEVKRWAAKRKSALVLDIIQGKTTVAGVTGKQPTSDSTVLRGLIAGVANGLIQSFDIDGKVVGNGLASGIIVSDWGANPGEPTFDGGD